MLGQDRLSTSKEDEKRWADGVVCVHDGFIEFPAHTVEDDLSSDVKKGQ
jgi:hypothetical protein